MTDYIPILTAILVIVTIYYAWQTKRMVDEMVVSRRYQFVPSLKVTPTRLSLDDSFDIEICNIGLGPAKNIRGTLKLEPNGEEFQFVHPKLYPKEKLSRRAPFKEVKSFARAMDYTELKLIVSFEDITNIQHENTDAFIIADYMKIKNDNYTRDKTVETLKSMDRHLAEIAKSIKK